MFCLPVHTVVHGGARGDDPRRPVPARCSSPRSRSPSRSRPATDRRRGWRRSWPSAAIVAGVLLARGGVQREVFIVLVFLLVGLRAVGLAFRDWREPIAGSFLVGALVLAVGVGRRRRSTQDWGPPLIVADAGVLRRIAGEPRGIRVDDGRRARNSRADERDRWVRRAVSDHASGSRSPWSPRSGSACATGCSITSGRSWRRSATRLVSVLVFVFDAARATHLLARRQAGHRSRGRPTRAGSSGSGAPRTRASARSIASGQPSLLGRILGSRALRPGGLVADPVHAPAHAGAGGRPTGRPRRPVAVGHERSARRAAARHRVGVTRREPPADRVRRWYGEVLVGARAPRRGRWTPR